MSIKLIMQPNPCACGQACIAMLAGVSVDEVIKYIHWIEINVTMNTCLSVDYIGYKILIIL